MPSAKFYLRKPSENKPQPIYLTFRYKNERLMYGTGYSVLPKYWNPEKCRVRNVTEEPNRDIINNHLNELQTAIQNIYVEMKRAKVTITKANLRRELDYYLGNEIRPGDETLFQYIERFIERSKGAVKYRTIQRYITTLNHLKDFAETQKQIVDFSTIDQDLYNSFVDHLSQNHNMAVNTIGVYIKNLKVFLRSAHEDGVTDSTVFNSRWFKVLSEETEHIYLNKDEIQQMYEFDLSHNPRLEKVRDLFVVGCWTGCRFSDLSRLSPENIKGDMITITQQKTGAKVAIPVHSMVREILNKYEGKLPRPISNQKMNDYLKELAEMVGLDDSFSRGITKGGVKRKRTYKKYELLTSHAARRSFATNQYLDGVPSETIREITGHKTERAFQRYLKLTSEEHAKILLNHWQRNEPMRKVK